MKEVKKIVLSSQPTRCIHNRYENKIIVTSNKISCSLVFDKKTMFKYEDDEFEYNAPKNVSWSHKYSIIEMVLLERIFDYAKTFEYSPKCFVLDGQGIDIEIEYEDGSKYESGDSYGDSIGPEYDSLFSIIQLISFLIPKNKYKPDFFNAYDPWAKHK